jgi:hypothetical protein
VLGLADRRIEAAGSVCRSDCIPQRDACLTQGCEPLAVIERSELDADRVPDEVPEEVTRVSVIAALGERDFSRQAAEDEDARVGRGNGCECGLADQNVVPLP